MAGERGVDAAGWVIVVVVVVVVVVRFTRGPYAGLVSLLFFFAPVPRLVGWL